MKLLKWLLEHTIVPILVALIGGGGVVAYVTFFENHPKVSEQSVVAPAASPPDKQGDPLPKPHSTLQISGSFNDIYLYWSDTIKSPAVEEISGTGEHRHVELPSDRPVDIYLHGGKGNVVFFRDDTPGLIGKISGSDVFGNRVERRSTDGVIEKLYEDSFTEPNLDSKQQLQTGQQDVDEATWDFLGQWSGENNRKQYLGRYVNWTMSACGLDSSTGQNVLAVSDGKFRVTTKVGDVPLAAKLNSLTTNDIIEVFGQLEEMSVSGYRQPVLVASTIKVVGKVSE